MDRDKSRIVFSSDCASFCTDFSNLSAAVILVVKPATCVSKRAVNTAISMSYLPAFIVASRSASSIASRSSSGLSTASSVIHSWISNAPVVASISPTDLLCFSAIWKYHRRSGCCRSFPQPLRCRGQARKASRSHQRSQRSCRHRSSSHDPDRSHGTTASGHPSG